jgi:glycosyltransferase involved in cell wall biosynthesis
MPKVTFFMPVYNRAHTIRESLDSVLAQTFKDFELLLIDDGSTDDSAAIIESYDDPRIRLLRHEQNQGIPKTRNEGLREAAGEYLALLDSDDLAHPRRLEKQVRVLDENPRLAAVGSWLKTIDESGRPKGILLRPVGARRIHARIPFTSCFKNPAMTARTALMREYGYREQFVYCQDIDMWARMSVDHEFTNIPEFLTHYRTGGMSHTDPPLSRRLRTLVGQDQLTLLGARFTQEDIDRHFELRNPSGLRPDGEFLAWCKNWLEHLVETNRARGLYPEPEFSRAAAERWLLVAARGRRMGHRGFAPSRSSPLRRAVPGLIGEVVRLGITSAPRAAVSFFS